MPMKVGMNLPGINFYSGIGILHDAMQYRGSFDGIAWEPWGITHQSGGHVALWSDPPDGVTLPALDARMWPIGLGNLLDFSYALASGPYTQVPDFPAGPSWTWATGTGVYRIYHQPGSYLDFTCTGGTTTPQSYTQSGLTDGIKVAILQSDPADHLRDIRIVPQGSWGDGPTYAAALDTRPFTPLFEERVAPFEVLRWLDTQKINNNDTQEDWSERTAEGGPATGPGGMALETILGAGNRLGRDVWLCIPYKASNAYAEAMGALARAELDAGRTVYLEYANEVWHPFFWQSGYVENLGIAAGNSLYEQKAILIRERFDAFLEGWGPDERDRVVRVMAGQHGNKSNTVGTINYLLALGGDGGFDAISTGPYFGDADHFYPYFDTGPGAGVDRDDYEELAAEVFGPYLDATLAVVADGFYPRLRHALQHRLGRPIKLVAYEAGTHEPTTWDGPAGTVAPNLVALHRDARKVDAYLKYLTTKESQGWDLLNLYAFTGEPKNYGAWGHLEYLDSAIPGAESRKYEAAISFIEGERADVPDPDPLPTYLPADDLDESTASMAWDDVYGALGYRVLSGSTDLPAGVAITLGTGGTATGWDPNSGANDPANALADSPGSAVPRAGVWYGATTFDVEVAIPADAEYTLTMYLLDWDSQGERMQQIRMLDAADGSVLEARQYQEFRGGGFASWQVDRDVVFRFENVSYGFNAVVSGFFLDEPGLSPPPPDPDPPSGLKTLAFGRIGVRP